MNLEEISKDWLEALCLHSDLNLQGDFMANQLLQVIRLCPAVSVCTGLRPAARKNQMSTWLICRGGTRASRCTSCRNNRLRRGIPLRLPGSRILDTPAPAQGETDSPPPSPDSELEIIESIFGKEVPKGGPPCGLCGFKRHKVETFYRKHPHLRRPSGALNRGPKEKHPCKGCGSSWDTTNKCLKLHQHLEVQRKKAPDPCPKES